MSAPTPAAGLVRFRGTPSSLTGVVPEGLGGTTDLALSVRPRGSKVPVEASVYTDSDPRILRMTLPHDFGPGKHEAVLVVDGKERPAMVEVDAAPLLRVIPEQLRFAARPGDVVDADLTLLNLGNVVVTLRSVQVIGVFMAGGVERALRRGYMHTLSQGERRVDIIADGLAEAHGGLVKMKIHKGAGEIGPGELRALEVALDVPRELATGAVYAGNWELEGLVFPITITVPGSKTERAEEEGEGEQGEGKDVPR